ncbi:MAG: ABC transporter substrate-binding protein, partial [Oscillochloris sp.]|nr:ABC transporter substrate-binding protein [Oscillochloris sp.]
CPAAEANRRCPAAPVAEAQPAAQPSGDDLESLEITTPQRIEFWHIQATIYGDAIKEIVAEFNRQNQGKIEVVEVFQGSYGDLNQKIRAALQGGGLPDVAMAYENDTVEYMRAGVVVPLDMYIDSPTWGLNEAELSDIASAVLARQRVPQYDGATMSWPHGNSAQGVYYNIDILEQAGFDAPARTWPEFLEQARTIKEVTGLPTLPIRGPGGVFRNMVRSYGLDIINPDGTVTSLNSPAAIESLTMLKTMIDEELAIITEESEQEFTNGRTAMEFGTTARTSTKLELIGDTFRWGMALTPQAPDNNRPVTDLYGGNQVLFKHDDPQRQLAAWLFLKYFSGPEAQAIYAARTGYFPATISSQDTELLSTNYTENPQKQQAFEMVFPYAKIDTPTAASNAIYTMINDTTLEVLLGRITPEDAAARMQEEADRLLADLAG